MYLSRTLSRVLAAGILCSTFNFGADDSLTVIHRIKTEAFDHSQVMDALGSLTDRYGPRLTGSPEFGEAAEWAVSQLRSYGVANVHGEKWGPFGRAWSLGGYTLEMTAPRYSHLIAVPLAWSAPTEAIQSGDALYAPFRTEGFDINKNRELFEQYKTKWRGKLQGKIVLISESKVPKPSDKPLFRRYTDAELSDMAKAPTPSIRRNVPVDKLEFPTDPEEQGPYFSSLSSTTQDEFIDRYIDERNKEGEFFRQEGVRAVIRADTRAHNGLLFAEQAGSEKAKQLASPTFVVTEEQYSRMVRLIEKKVPVSLRFSLQAKVSESNVDGLNLVGEIPGQRKPDEVVMIGAHFDSWHSGTGATDNGAGSAVMLEVMRVLSTLHLPMDRTVRIGLWSGEEEGLYGSKAYVAAHFGDPKTMQLKPEAAKLDAYLNLDNGSGKIRGVYLQGNDSARPLFEKMMHPFADLGVTTITLRNTGGTDHLSFDAVGIPGFQFIQDPLDYGTATHHSDVDTFDHAIPEDLMQAVAVISSMVYDIANAPDAFPRKPTEK